LQGRTLAPGRLLDVVGCVLHHGRWERQACTWRTDYNLPNSPTFRTGQFWVRTWLQLADHSSSTARLAVKAYMGREEWEQVCLKYDLQNS
jgi:hypothetical protein